MMRARTRRACGTLVLIWLLHAGCGNELDTAPEAPDEAEQSPIASDGTPVVRGMQPAPPDLAAPPGDAIATASGLQMRVLGGGKRLRKPEAHDRVEVVLSGWTSDGQQVETTPHEGTATLRALSDFAPGLREALREMTAGERRRVWVPAHLASSDGSSARDRVYDLELVRIEEGVPPLLAPADLSRPPPDAERTPSGLIYRVLARADTPGTRPRAGDRVEIHYTAWTHDGKVLDSSVARGEPAMRALSDLAPGWAEGLRLMREGEQLRVWIPADLAQPSDGEPRVGALVVDVELLEVHAPSDSRP